MKRILTTTLASAFALSLCLADAKEDVKAAAKKLADAANYSWTATTEIEGGPFTPAPVMGKAEKGGYAVLTTERDSTTTTAVLKGDKGVLKTEDGWQTAEELRAMRFGWRVVKHVKSNAIVYCGPDRTLGIGAGQMSRVDASRIAVWKAQEARLSLRGSVVCSDAFFPFPDGLIAAAEAGATAAIQPGGSMRDQEVIAAANDRGVAMVCTGNRHFRH